MSGQSPPTRGELRESTSDSPRQISAGRSAFEVMGIVNVTPDSFSDGGDYLDAQSALAHSLELVQEGASILDVGGESTRPGAEPVSLLEECRRVIPVVESLVAAGVGARISVETSRSPSSWRQPVHSSA
jgi:dihydropteroate synthase